MTVHGCASVELELDGEKFKTEIVVVSLGHDFYRHQLIWPINTPSEEKRVQHSIERPNTSCGSTTKQHVHAVQSRCDPVACWN